MHLHLNDAELRELAFELPRPSGDGGEPGVHRLRLRSARGLGGTIDQSAEGLRVEGMRAAAIELDALQLDFGTVRLAAEPEGVLEVVECRFAQHEGRARTELGAERVQACRLELDVAGIALSADARMAGMRLRIHDAEGSFEAGPVTLSGFRAAADGLAVEAVSVRAARLVIAWGPGVFRLAIDELAGDELSLRSGGVAVQAAKLTASHVSVRDGHVALGVTSLEGTSVDVRLDAASTVPRADAGGSQPSEPAPPLALPWSLLDGLSGEVNVDLRVDLAVPILGRRRATHRFRIAVADGSLNFRDVENDLSTLENALLDFAVRDGALVLERGIPLIPTRGRGTPIVIWDLTPDDLALAESHRVRLAVLPSYRLASDEKSGAEEGGGGGSPVALRELGLEGVDVRLRLAPPASPLDGPIASLAFGALAIEGALHPVTEGPARPGELRIGVEDLEATGLAISRARLERLRVGRAQGIQIAFEGQRVTSIRATLDVVALEGLALGPAGA